MHEQSVCTWCPGLILTSKIYVQVTQEDTKRPAENQGVIVYGTAAATATATTATTTTNNNNNNNNNNNETTTKKQKQEHKTSNFLSMRKFPVCEI